MIVRLMGEGQFRVDDSLARAAERARRQGRAGGRGGRRARALGRRSQALADAVRANGEKLADDGPRAVGRDHPARGPLARGGARAAAGRGVHPGRPRRADVVMREIVLATRPQGEPKESDFELREVDDARAGRRRGARAQRVRLGRPVHARTHDRDPHLRRRLRASARRSSAAPWDASSLRGTKGSSEGDWVQLDARLARRRDRRGQHAAQARPARCASVDRARRAGHARVHRVDRARGRRAGEGRRDDLRLRRRGRGRQRRRADRKAQGLARDRERGLGGEGRVAARRSGRRRSTTAKRPRARRSQTGSTCTSTTSAATSSRPR